MVLEYGRLILLSGAPGTTRTYDQQIRSLRLYPAELRARDLSSSEVKKNGVSEGT